MTERLVLYNPIGLVDTRFTRPWPDTDEAYRQNLAATWQTTRAGIGRYVAHNPAAWNDEFEKYTRIRYAWTLSAEWPRFIIVTPSGKYRTPWPPIVMSVPPRKAATCRSSSELTESLFQSGSI